MNASSMLRSRRPMARGHRGVVVAWKYFGETSEQAWARWRIGIPAKIRDKAAEGLLVSSA